MAPSWLLTALLCHLSKEDGQATPASLLPAATPSCPACSDRLRSRSCAVKASISVLLRIGRSDEREAGKTLKAQG